MQISTITTKYDPDQDRIILAVADTAEVTLKLWLTRRLTQRLIPALLQGLQDQISAPPDAQPQALEAANVYAQLQARITKKPAHAVQTQDATAQHLVTEIGIQVGKQGAKTLEFRCAELPEPAILSLNATELRQWLEVLKHANDKGQWQLDVFPDWLAAAAS